MPEEKAAVGAAADVRRAEPHDLEALLDVLSEAARWLRSRGIEQWPDRFPPEHVEPALVAGETFLAWRGGRAVGTLTLQWADVVFWDARNEDAGYVHRLAVRREAAGLGAGLLAWADAQTAAAGRRYLRLDCMAESAGLRAYYRRLGFEVVGEVEVGGFRAALHERECRA